MDRPNHATISNNVTQNAKEIQTILIGNSRVSRAESSSSVPAFVAKSEEFVAKKSDLTNQIKLESENKVDFEKVFTFITDNKILLNQYYKLRNEIFQKERGWTKKTWFESEHDRNGKIVIALNEQGELIGGLRVMSSTQNKYLSDENPGTEYTYRNLLKSVGLDENLHYVEVDGVVVKPEYRNRIAMKGIVQIAIDYAESEGCSYIIGIAPLHICRNDRAILKSLGYTEALIATKFPWTQLDIYNGSIDYPVIGVKSKT